MKYIFYIVFCFFFLEGFSQGSDFTQTWIAGAYQKDFDLKEKTNALNIRFDGSYRSIEWFRYNRQFIIREITSYNFNAHWQLGAGPCVSWQYPYYDPKPVLEFRPTFQLIGKTFILTDTSGNGKYEKNKSEISIRFRYELRYFKTNDDWSKVYNRPRLALRSSLALSEKVSFIPMIEGMWQKDPHSKINFSVLRITPGFNYKHKGINYQFAFMFQFLEKGQTDERDNNFIFGFSN